MSKRFKVINVLTPEYYADAHIKGSINVPLAELKDFAEATPKDVTIVVYCAHYACDQSARAWHILHEHGFDNVLAYEGGINDWYHAGYPTEGNCTAEYLHKTFEPVNDDRTMQTITKEALKARMEREELL